MAVKTLNTLIKVHKQRVDVLRREMVALEEERHQLQILADKLRTEHEQEMQLILKEPDFAGFFGAYSGHVKQKLNTIGEETKRLDAAIEKKRQEISEEFSEQKKYEIAEEHLKKRLLEEEKHRQQQRFDEVGSQQYMKLKEDVK